MQHEILYLASRSPRRLELLSQIGVHPEMIVTDVDESVLPGETPEDYVRRLAVAKAQAAHEGLARKAPVIGSDTAVVIDDRILGKPLDRQHAVEMLTGLAGRTHRVLTGVALINAGVHYRLSESRVCFRQISEEEAGVYWDTGEPADKAGGYGIQGLGAVFVASLEGSYSGVMGLPLFETSELLAKAGIQLLLQQGKPTP